MLLAMSSPGPPRFNDADKHSGQRILCVAFDPTLAETRKLLLQHAGFDVATAEAATRVRLAVDAVELARYPAGTAALLKAAALMRERFFADARRALLQAVAANPEEPTLHLLLGDVYERIGLDNLAAAEYDQAETLSVRR